MTCVLDSKNGSSLTNCLKCILIGLIPFNPNVLKAVSLVTMDSCNSSYQRSEYHFMRFGYSVKLTLLLPAVL